MLKRVYSIVSVISKLKFKNMLIKMTIFKKF